MLSDRCAVRDEQIARDLLAEERTLAEERRRSLTFECPICMDPKPIDDSFTAECDHRVCGTCQLEHICVKVRERQVGKGELTCVHCSHDLTENEVIGTLTAHGETELVDVFQEARNELLFASEGFRRCPSERCNHVFAWERGDPLHYDCPACASAFCLACTVADPNTPAVGPAHPGRTCAQQRERLAQASPTAATVSTRTPALTPVARSFAYARY